MENIDRRSRRTKDLLLSTFKEMMMKHDDYMEISVTELCEKADVSRRSFYTHYSELDDLFKQMQTEAIKRFFALIKDFDVFADIHKVVQAFFEINTGDPVYEKMLLSNHYNYVRASSANEFVSMLGMFEKMNGVNHNPKYIKVVLIDIYYQICAICYRNWTNSGKKIPQENMIDLAANLIKGGISPYVI